MNAVRAQQSLNSDKLLPQHTSYRIRRWTGCEREAQEIRRLWQQGLLETGLTRSRFGIGSLVSPKTTSDPATLGSEAVSKMLRSHQRKQAAAAAARQLKAEAAALAATKPRESARALAEAQRMRRQRMFACLVAERLPCEGETPEAGRLAAYCLVSITQPLALLPPPLPSSSPLLLHIDALTVGEDHRRRGLATQLLGAVDKLARRWGRRSIWLRVCPTNAAAIELYRSLGYEEVQLREPPWFKSLRRNDDVLMCKSLPQMPPVSCSQQDSVKRTGTRDKREVPSELRMEPLGESGEKKKVYRWDEEE
ncbi:acyl-CoA N-acyltransferase [Dunaliella salina]|uniref:Acyl-CoA N-acyltransferase n=1 Tax=Dunaliella salina TaxID=3046 RepID=A0ABQ7G8J6_DUNSA|nr:acyl-CoA N-acyltransferase [Dunaliella salina]|eukprot:KAF5830933.1 acyl-CoA N-acyltransferase [Dunaliella salina]